MNPLLIEIPDEIATERLLLRSCGVAEVAELNHAMKESFGELKLWLPWAQTIPTSRETLVYCRRAIAEHVLREEITYRIFLRESSVLAGSIWLTRLNWKVPSFEMGYWMRTDQCGRGYMTEAVQAMTAVGFENAGAKRIEIRTDERNARSRKVAERAGYELEAVLRNQCRFPDDTLCDTCVYAKIAT